MLRHSWPRAPPHRPRSPDSTNAATATVPASADAQATGVPKPYTQQGTTRSTSPRMSEQRTSKDQHLYLAFDDWNSGYSIREVSLSRRSGKQPLSSDSGKDSEQPALSFGPGNKGAKPLLPLPVFMRVSAQRGFPEFFTSAFGTKIVAMHPRSLDDIGVPTIDVLDRTCTYEIEQNIAAAPIYFPISDDRLFALDIGTFEVLQKPKRSGKPRVWKKLARPPFRIWDVSSYGTQPDGCILVSAKRDTFIFDTKDYVWELCGRWVFPFTGRGHYDPSLKGFVGLSKERETLGYLYCCTMASTMIGDTGELAKPDVKCTKHTVYSEDPAEGQHVSATLVHMRPGKFCLVECVCITDQFRVPPGPDQMELMRGEPQGDRFMYRVKTFSLSIVKGDLKLKNSKVFCYSLPHEARIGSIYQDPVAFWM